MQSRVILVNFEYPPIAGPGIWRMFALSRDLSSLGFDVQVVCSDRSSWHTLTDATLLERIPDSVRVHRVSAPLLSDWKARLASRQQNSRNALTRAFWQRAERLLARYAPDPVFAWVPRAARVIRHAARDGSGPVTIISSGPTHLSHIAALVARDRRTTAWIMDYRDLWTSDPTLVYPGPYQLRLFRRIERFCLRACDAVVSVTPSWLQDIAVVVGKDPAVSAKLHVIRNGHDLTAQRLAGLQLENRTNERLHVHFSGTLQSGTRESAIALLEALALLRDRRRDLALPRMTFTGLHRRVAEAVQRLQLDDIVEDVGYRNQDDALRLSAAADVLLVLVDAAGPGRRGVVPAKTYECIALGRHVLAIVPPDSDVEALLVEYGAASVCSEDPASISVALETLALRHAREPGSLRMQPGRGQDALEPYSRQAAAVEFARLLDDLAVTRKPPVSVQAC